MSLIFGQGMIHNLVIQGVKAHNSFLQQLGSLFTGSEREAQFPVSSSKSSKEKPKTNTKGFDSQNLGKKSKGKKR